MLRRTRAFTLIELLVVIAIISLLISILIPSLSQAREQAKKVKCGVNLKSIGTGLVSCQTDNRDFGPSWDDGEAQGNTGGSNKYLYTWGEVLFDLGYLGNRDVLICPTDRLPDRRVEIRGAQPAWSQWKWVDIQGAGQSPQPGWRGSYGINAIMHGNFQEDRFQDPSRQVYIADGWWVWFENVGAYQVMFERLLNSPPPSPLQPTEGSTVAWRHGKRLDSNFLFVDGHVETITPKRPSNQLELLFDTVDTVNAFTWLPGESASRSRFHFYNGPNAGSNDNPNVRIRQFDRRRPKWAEVRATGRGGYNPINGSSGNGAGASDNWHPGGYPPELNASWRTENRAWRNIESNPNNRF